MDNIVRYDGTEKKIRKSNKPKSILEMVEDDWVTFKTFIREKRKYIFWIIVFFITISFVDVLSLGDSWENACKGGIMKGGDGGNAPTSTKNAASNTSGDNDVGDGNKPKPGNDMKKKKGDAQDALNSSASKGKKSGKMGKGKGISGSPTSMFLSNGVGVVKKAFMMFATILMIAGALSVPFLLIIIVTYTIIKQIANHFMSL